MDNLQNEFSDGWMERLLRTLEEQDNLRTLRDLRCEGKYIIDEEGRRYLNLSSNDYLGLSDVGLQREFFAELASGIWGGGMEPGVSAEFWPWAADAVSGKNAPCGRGKAAAMAGKSTGGVLFGNRAVPDNDTVSDTGAAAGNDTVPGAWGGAKTGSAVPGALGTGGRFLMSNPSSRLVTGNSPEYAALESSLAALWPGREALVLGCGYLANAGVLPALTGKEDLILGDKLLHASVIDGLKLCAAEWRRFRHNDMNHLESLLRKQPAGRRVWVATESVFSMDGDRAPLKELAALKQKYGFKLYLDEAHAFGVFGPRGEGLAVQEGVASEVDLLVATLGKALASAGAFVITDALTRRVLVNRMRTLIFSTALPPLNLMWSDFLVRKLPGFGDRREHLRRLTGMLSSDPGATQIVPVMAYENKRALEMAARLRMAGFWTTAIRHPTVPEGEARVRISLSAALSEEDMKRFVEVWKRLG